MRTKFKNEIDKHAYKNVKLSHFYKHPINTIASCHPAKLNCNTLLQKPPNVNNHVKKNYKYDSMGVI